jgi:formate dehydrogenase major subunit
MDCCRSAVRLGAENVYVIYRRTRDEMPAEDDEIEEAIEEGVDFKFLTNPDEILGKDGKVCGVKLQVMELGEPDASGRRKPVPVEGKFEELELDSVIAALGHGLVRGEWDMLQASQKGNIDCGENSFRTSMHGVFACGECTNKGATIAVRAIGQAGKCAEMVDKFLNESDAFYKEPFYSERKVDETDLADEPKKPRVEKHLRPAEERRCDFSEINL